ncbi:amidohydrolase [Vibrio japonicus]|uniref:Amidohydrolase n=1 Tax=Vibrio japonicus TaxID=1824638 RepID=A0ABY5LKM2_9VIBR|nr:amidohydrolase [Vibrio japonicus]UUM31338.1 amidohydrolase [Vibrio japonicus]
MSEQLDTTPTFDAIAFRQQLHRFPELSGDEVNTAQVIATQLTSFGLKPIIGVGGHGLFCVIDSGKQGQTTLFRADFDALPITEKATHGHVSQHDGIMHACGHDGHTASLLKVAKQLSITPPAHGKVILLFQPAEETGTGASAMINDPRLTKLPIDNVFAYHNLPGYQLSQIIIKDQTFACASVGAMVGLKGKTSHAARPENGVSPTNAMVDLIGFLQTLPENYRDAFCLVTIVHASLGEEAFGIAPGEAKVMATMRSDCNQAFGDMKVKLAGKVEQLALQHGLEVEITWEEPFNAAVNSTKHVELVKSVARHTHLDIHELEEPMRWSEDFAEFLTKWNGALFCIGSGESHPELHNPDYDFPDAILDTANSVFLGLVNELHR